MIRKAVPDDLRAIVRLGIESLNNNPLQGFIIDEDKVKQTAIDCISSPSNFAWVSEIGGEVVGAVGAMVFPFQFFQKKQCSIVMFYCKVSGDGGRLLKKVVNWYKSRSGLRMLELTFEKNIDQKEYNKIRRFLEKLGLREALPVYAHFK